MAYDAEIRVGTKVDATPLEKLEKSFEDISERVEIAKKKMEALDKAGAPKNSEAWKEAAEDFEKWSNELEKVSKEQQKLQEEQNKTTQSLNYFKREIEKYKAILADLESNDKYFGDEEYDIAYASLKRLEAMLGVYKKSVANSSDSTNVFKQQISELSVTLAELEREGFSLGDKEYDDIYIALQNVIDAQKEYKANLNKMTAKGMAEEAAKVAKELEKQAEAQRKIEEAAERNLQKENARLEKEAQIEAKKQAEIAEQNRLNEIHGNAVVSNQRLVDLYEEQQQLLERMAVLKKAGVTSGYEEYDNLKAQLAKVNATIKSEEDLSNYKKTSEGLKKITSSAKKAYAALSNGAQSAFGRVSSVAKKAFGSMNKDAKKTNGLLATMRSRMQGLALSLLVFNQVTKAFNAMVSGAKEGIAEFAKYSKDCNAVLSDFKSSLQTMKFNLGAAFAPIIQTIIPYLTVFINVLNSVISKISQFFAVLTGSSTYYRAIQQQVDFAGSLEDTANAAKEAAGALAGFDKLNVVKQEDSSSSGSSGGGSSTGGGFEEVPIDSKIKELAEKVKEILAQLFAPLQEAWERQGQFVIDSWKSALNEIWLLVKDIGRDFLIMWNEEETVKIFENLLIILGDIGLIIANFARNFREAWNENQNGLRIFEGIRDIIGIIVENIREAADATVKWTEDLNFSPLLEKISNWLDSLEPVVDSLSGVLSDFYTQVLLPLAGWAVEEGLPDLLQVFIDFNNAVDWEGLRTRLSEFWEVLEPFAETVGEGLITFIGDLSQKIAEFTQSETFQKMLDWLEEKMASTTPEDIAKGIERIVEAIILFKTVSLGLSALTAIAPAITTIKSFLDLFKGGAGTVVAGEITTVSTALESLATAFAGGILGYAGFQMVKNPIADAMVAAGIVSEETAEDMKRQFSSVGGVVEATGDVIGGVGNALNGLPAVMSGAEHASAAFGAAMDEIAKGSIYTDEQMKKMQETWGFTEEDMESLRQEMLLTNPELRAIADGFGMFDASAETLKDVSTGMQLISDGTVSASQAAEEFQKPMWNMTEEAKQFFTELSTGKVTLDEYQQSILEGAGYSQEFVNSLDNAFTGMEGFNKNATAAGLNAGLSLAKGLQDSKSDISTSIEGLGTQIESKGSELSKQSTVLGNSTITGFVNGIVQNMNATDKPLKDWEDRIVKTIHDGALKFGSPSKTTEEFGADTVTGYNNGIKKNVSKTIAVIKSYMQTIQSTFKTLVKTLYLVGQESISSLIKGLASKQAELKKTVEDITKLMGEAATASSSIKIPTGTSTTGTKSVSFSQLATSSVVRGGNPYGAALSKQSTDSSNSGISTAAIKQAVKEGMKESGGREVTVIAQLDGKILYKETVRQDQITKKSIGKSRLGN